MQPTGTAQLKSHNIPDNQADNNTAFQLILKFTAAYCKFLTNNIVANLTTPRPITTDDHKATQQVNTSNMEEGTQQCHLPAIPFSQFGGSDSAQPGGGWRAD